MRKKCVIGVLFCVQKIIEVRGRLALRECLDPEAPSSPKGFLHLQMKILVVKYNFSDALTNQLNQHLKYKGESKK